MPIRLSPDLLVLTEATSNVALSDGASGGWGSGRGAATSNVELSAGGFGACATRRGTPGTASAARHRTAAGTTSFRMVIGHYARRFGWVPGSSFPLPIAVWSSFTSLRVAFFEVHTQSSAGFSA